MKKEQRNRNLLYLLSFALIAYLLINTGIVSDDFGHMHYLKDKSLTDTLFVKNVEWFLLPAEHFILLIWYRFFQIHNLIVVNILKISYIFLAFYLMAKFFEIYLDMPRAALASFLFIFFPSHDSTAYWFLGHYLTLSIAFYLYAFYLAHKNKLFFAFLMASIASFMCYGSPVIAVSLFVLFLLNKDFKKAAIMIIPNISFVFYYIFISKFATAGVRTIPAEIDIRAISNQMILQVVTFADSMFGPSMWLKIYYSFFQLSVASLIIGILLTIVFYKTYQETQERYNPKLILSLGVLTLLSFAMFAITGYYPQLAFNVGNRVTIFGSLLAAYLIVLMPGSKKLKTAIFALLIFTILGISGHWKTWSAHQQQVITNIANNQDLQNYRDARFIYVSGNQFSKYGKISHIEFFSEGAVTAPVFNLALKNDELTAIPINKRLRFIDGHMVDRKYNVRQKVDRYINVYDSEKDSLFKVDAGDINKYIDSLPGDKRHWIQIVNVKFIKNILIKRMPRLKYDL